MVAPLGHVFGLEVRREGDNPFCHCIIPQLSDLGLADLDTTPQALLSFRSIALQSAEEMSCNCPPAQERTVRDDSLFGLQYTTPKKGFTLVDKGSFGGVCSMRPEASLKPA